MTSSTGVLRDLADIRVGYQARAGVQGDPAGLFELVRAQDFDHAGNLVGPKLRFDPLNRPDKYLIFEGDILLLARGKAHPAYLTEAMSTTDIASSTFYIIRPIKSKNLTSAYLAWWLNQAVAQSYFKEHRGTSTLQFISKAAVELCPVTIPSEDTQLKIASLISLAKREQNLMAGLAKHKATLIQETCRMAVMGKS